MSAKYAAPLRRFFLCLLAAAVALLFCSKSAPIYPLNDWFDANIFFTMGKSMMNGRILYLDVFDQKGPLLYFLYGIGWCVSHTTFLGIYLLESVFAAFFLYFALGCLEVLVGPCSSLWAFALALAAFPNATFFHGGSAEEFCLPFLAFALLLYLRALYAKEPAPLPARTILLAGLGAGCVFWIKYTVTGFFLVWVLLLAALYLRRGWVRPLCKAVGFYLAGMAVATLPWLLYFGLNGALPALWECYFYDNIALYSGSAPTGLVSQVVSFLRRFWWGCHDFPAFALCLVAALGTALVALWRHRRPRGIVGLCLLALGLGFGIFWFGTYRVYYFFPFAVFLPLGFVPAVWAARRLPATARRRAAPFLAVGCLALCLLLAPNRYMLGLTQAQLPQYCFRDEILSAAPASLMNYGTLDGGFFLTTGLLPSCRYFVVTNIPLPAQQQAQDAVLAGGGVSSVVSLSPDLAAQFPLYALQDSCSYDSGEGPRTWYLYRRTS